MSYLSYMSWVPAYTKVRWGPARNVCVAEYVGGHWRRKAHCKRNLDTLACVCQSLWCQSVTCHRSGKSEIAKIGNLATVV